MTVDHAIPSLESQYAHTLDYLFQLQRVGVKYTLDNIRYLLEHLGNPHRHLPVVHIVGTNGKGSTAAMLYSIARAAGYAVARYTSPHLVDFRERIEVNGERIPVDYVVAFVNRLRPVIEAIQPSFFEVTTAMALQYFAEQSVDLVILEAGMGGRLDSTNVVRPLLTLVTPIAMDHQNYLGNTLAAIAREKAGVFKPGVPVLTNNTHPTVLSIFQAQAETVDTRLERVAPEHVQVVAQSLEGLEIRLQHPRWAYPRLYLNLLGTYQAHNALLAVAAAHRLEARYPGLTAGVVPGLREVPWRGRLHVVRRDPLVIVDVSHNSAGMATTLQEIRQLAPGRPIHVVIGLQADKDFQAMGKILAQHADTCYVTGLPTPRSLSPQLLLQQIVAAGGEAQLLENLSALFAGQLLTQNPQAVWLITGSHYLAGEAYRILEKA